MDGMLIRTIVLVRAQTKVRLKNLVYNFYRVVLLTVSRGRQLA